LALKEVLLNVPPGAPGDANADGVRDPYEDEFVELVNVAGQPLELRGVQIFSGGKLKYTFEPLCLLADEAIIVFGGGSVGPGIDNAVVSETRFAFPNDGGTLKVVSLGGVVAEVSYGAAPAASLTRFPELAGEDWVSHTEIAGLVFSPGTCADGSPFVSRCAPRVDSPDAGAD
jgi:hypothetical protein